MPIKVETWKCEFCLPHTAYTGDRLAVTNHEKLKHFQKFCTERAKELVVRLERMGADPNDERTQAIVVGSLGQYPLTLKIATAIWNKRHPHAKRITPGYNKDNQDHVADDE